MTPSLNAHSSQEDSEEYSYSDSREEKHDNETEKSTKLFEPGSNVEKVAYNWKILSQIAIYYFQRVSNP